MKLKDAETLAKKLMKKHLPSHWAFGFDKAKRRLGCCHYEQKKITLSAYYVINNDEDVVKDTILHEIAHAYVPIGSGHGPVWRKKAIEIGCTGLRCKDESMIEPTPGRFAYKCKDCGYQMRTHKRLKRKHACVECCKKHNRGRFSEKYVLEGQYIS